MNHTYSMNSLPKWHGIIKLKQAKITKLFRFKFKCEFLEHFHCIFIYTALLCIKMTFRIKNYSRIVCTFVYYVANVQNLRKWIFIINFKKCSTIGCCCDLAYLYKTDYKCAPFCSEFVLPVRKSLCCMFYWNKFWVCVCVRMMRKIQTENKIVWHMQKQNAARTKQNQNFYWMFWCCCYWNGH